jgi:hypothetical protein
MCRAFINGQATLYYRDTKEGVDCGERARYMNKEQDEARKDEERYWSSAE